MTTKDDIERTIENNIATGGPVWSLLTQIDEPAKPLRRRYKALIWIACVLVVLGLIFSLSGCKSIERAKARQAKTS